MTRPLVVVLDIDGTIIGEILPQVIEWQIVSSYRKEFLRQYKFFLIDALKTHLIRPGLDELMEGLKENAEFFIFTASEHKWANFIVPCIEAALGVQFNRPIFTRNHMVVNKNSGSYQKSLEKILPTINRTLRKKGYDENATLKDCVLVDNNQTLLPEESSRLILCPTHKYTLYTDVLRFIPIESIRENLGEISRLLREVGMLNGRTKYSSIEKLLKEYYEVLAGNVSSTYNVNISRDDHMWQRVYKAFRKYENTMRNGVPDKFVKVVTKKLGKSNIKDNE